MQPNLRVHDKHEINPNTREFYECAKAALIDGARPRDRVPVLSHCDLADVNFIIKFILNEEGHPVGVEEVTIIDWATMYWSPNWLEPAGFFNRFYDGNKLYKEIYKEAFEKMGNMNLAMALFWGWGHFKGHAQP